MVALLRPLTRVAAACFWAVLLLGGCSRSLDLEGPHQTTPLDRIPIVLVPGIGREVADQLRGGTLVPFSGLTLRTDTQALASLGDPLFPAGAADADAVSRRLDRALRLATVRGLQDLLTTLVTEHGYVRGDPERVTDKDYLDNPPEIRDDRTTAASLFVVYYDWRRDIVENACVLASRIAGIQEQTGAERVHVIGYSLGGVVARYYLRYGGRDVIRNRACPLGDAGAVNRPGADVVERLITLGSPHRGSFLSFRSLLQDFSIIGLNLGVRDAVFTMPSAWELLPMPMEDADGRVPLLVRDGQVEAVSLYDVQTWEDNGWLRTHTDPHEAVRIAKAMLARARAVQARLAEPNAHEDAVSRLAITGDCRPTQVLAMVGKNGPEFLPRGTVSGPQIGIVTEPGDGVVSQQSALGMSPGPTLSTLEVCTTHNGYSADPAIRAQIYRFLQP